MLRTTPFCELQVVVTNNARTASRYLPSLRRGDLSGIRYFFAIVRTEADVVAGGRPRFNEASTYMQQVISVAEAERRARQRAMSIPEFCMRYDVGRTKAYEEINAGRLRARKVGKRTLISDDDAEDWLKNLPLINGSAAA